RPGARTTFLAALRRHLPFAAEIAVCDARDLLRLEREAPFDASPCPPDLTRFVSILSRTATRRPSVPFSVPAEGDWFVRVLAAKRRFVVGVYRRHMKTIGHLGRLDALFGAPATTRNWNTIAAIARTLRRS